MKSRISILASIAMLAACTPKQSADQTPATPAPAKAPAPGATPGTTTLPSPNGVATLPAPGTPAPDSGSAGGSEGGLHSASSGTTAPDSSGTGSGGLHNASAGAGAAAGATTTAAGASGTTAAAGSSGKHAPWSPPPAGYSLSNVTTWVAAHQAAHPGYHYVYIPPENAADTQTANILRVAMGKMWNHLSWKKDIDVPEDISGGAGLAFGLNAPGVWGNDAETNWGYGANCTPKNGVQVSPAPQGDCKTFAATDPMPIPNFVYNFSNGGPYESIQQTPSDYGSFSSAFNLGAIKYTSTHHNAIVCGPRIVAYRPVHLNAANVDTFYAFSSDEFDGRDGGNINYTSAPAEGDQRQTGSFNAGPGDGNTAIAAEWWMQLPNGFMYWGIHGEGGQERGKAEFPFAIDPANWKQGDELATGRSCITCHSNGINGPKSDPDKAGQNGWTSQSDLDAFYTIIRGKFQDSMKKLIVGLSDASDDLNNQMITGLNEPISKAIMIVEGPYTPGSNDCSFFCNGMYSTRNPLCETLPVQSVHK